VPDKHCQFKLQRLADAANQQFNLARRQVSALVKLKTYVQRWHQMHQAIADINKLKITALHLKKLFIIK
jgi:hypothetical protein